VANNVARIQAELDLDNGQFTGKISSSIGQLKSFGAAVNNTDKSIRNIERRVTGFGASVRDAMVVLGQFRASMMTVWAGTGQWVAAIIKANAELERMQALLKGVASGTEAQRNAQANSDLAYTIKLAQEAPFSLSAIGDSMVKLRSAGVEATSMMKAMTDAVAAFGGNDETLKRATIAIQQMAGKGVVSMEELRQQLGEAVPTAMKLMARGLNVTMAQLTKEVSKGTVEAKNALKAMQLEMAAEYEGSALRMMKTWTGMMAKLKTEWLLFAKNIGDAGLFDAAKNALRELSNTLSDPKTIASAKALGVTLGELVVTMTNGAKWILENQAAIIAWGKGIATVAAAGYLLSLIKNMQLWSNVMQGMAGSIVSISGKNQGLWRSFQGFTVMQQATVAANGMKGAMNGLLQTLTGFSGPVGLAIVAIGGLIGWLVKLQSEAKQAAADMRAVLALQGNEVLTDQQYTTATENLNNYTEALKKVTEARRLEAQQQAQGFNQVRGNRIRELMQEAAGLTGDSKMADSVIYGQDSWDKKIKALETYLIPRMNEVSKKVRMSVENQTKADDQRFVSSWSAKMDDSIVKVKERFSGLNAQLEADIESGKIKQADMFEARTKLMTDQAKEESNIYAAQIAVLEEGLKKQTGVEARRTQMLLQARREQKLAADQRYNDRLGARERGIVSLTEPGKDKNAEKKAKAQAQSLSDLLTTLRGKNAQLTASLEDDSIPALEKFEAILEEGKKYGNADSGMVAEIKELIAVNDELADKVKKSKATEKLKGDLEEMAAKASADVITESLKQSGDVYSKVAAGMVGFNREVAVMRVNLDKTNMSSKEFEEKVKEIQATLFKVDMIRFSDWVKDTNVENNTAILEDRDQVLAKHMETLRQYEIMRQNLIKSANGDKAQIDTINKGIDSVIATQEKRFNYESRTSWQKWLDDYRDITQEMDDVWAQSLDSMSNSLADMFVTGKSGWRDYATSILKEIARVMTAKVVGQFVEFAMSFFNFGGGGGTAGASKAGMTANTSASSAGSNVKGYANGGIHSSAGSLPLHKYATGGIAKTPQMALFGEGRLPEAYVPLPDGRSIPVTMEGATGGGTQNNVSINVTINNEGGGSGDAQSDTAQGRQLGKNLQSVVIKTIQEQQRPGGILWNGNTR